MSRPNVALLVEQSFDSRFNLRVKYENHAKDLSPTMNPDNQEKELFNAALEQPAEKRSAFLRDACGGNEELYHRVDELLQAFSASSRILAEISATAPGVGFIPQPEDDLGSR